jgi:hypothetical protein
VTINVNALGAVALVRMDGTALQLGDLIALSIVEIIYDGTSFRLLTLAAGQVQRTLPYSTIYIRTDGNDNNDGSANNAANAFATINGAAEAISKMYILNGQSVTLQLGNAGTYAPFRLSSLQGAITLRGDPSNPNLYVIAGNANGAVNNAAVISLQVDGVQLNNTGTLGHTFAASGGASVNFKRTVFAETGTSVFSHINASSGSSVAVGTGCGFNNNMGYFLLAQNGGQLVVEGGSTIFMSGACSAAVMVASGCSVVSLESGITFTGTVPTGKKYAVQNNGVMNSNGQTIPGTLAGTTSTGGQYV